MKKIFSLGLIIVPLFLCRSWAENSGGSIADGLYMAKSKAGPGFNLLYILDAKSGTLTVDAFDNPKASGIYRREHVYRFDAVRQRYVANSRLSPGIKQRQSKFYIAGIEVSSNSFIPENQCGGFCRLHPHFATLSIVQKRNVCINTIFRWKVLAENRGVGRSFFSEIDRTLAPSEFQAAVRVELLGAKKLP